MQFSAEWQSLARDSKSDEDNAENIRTVLPAAHLNPPFWPEWVYSHWVWENEGNTSTAVALVEDYIEHDIPVGCLLIDSPWETGYNTFEFDQKIYPNASRIVDAVHEMNSRIIFWITANVNIDSPNYQYGKDHGYYINNGQTVEWWKGEGSFIDYTNPDAMAWWHGISKRP